MAPSKLRKWRLKLLLLLVSTVLSLAVAEGIYRVRLYGWPALTPTGMNSIHDLGLSGLLREASPPRIGYELEPNLDETFKLASFRTNSRGLRDQEYEFEKPADVVRVAVIGDSFTMGSGVEIEDVYHSVLEDLLSTGAGSTKFECINFGVGGYGLMHYLAVFEKRALDYDPDLVLLALTQTDKTPSRPLKEFQPKPRTRPFWKLHLFADARDAYSAARRRKEAGVEPGAAAKEPTSAESGEVPLLPSANMDWIRRHFSKMAELSESTGVPVVAVFLQAHSSSPGETRFSKSFRVAAEEVGFPFLDTRSWFEGRHVREYRIFANDNHPNAEANGIFAEAIHEFLLEKGLIEAG